MLPTIQGGLEMKRWKGDDRRCFMPARLLARVPFVFLLASTALCPATHGQTLHPEFRHLSVADGLSHSQVASITQDRYGFIWIGTRSGLNRYDGYRCTVFKHRTDDPSSISGDFILSLCAASDGRLWIGTQNRGLNVFDPATGHFTHAPKGSPGAALTIPVLMEDHTGTLWVGTTDGLFTVDLSGSTFSLLPVSDSSTSPASRLSVVRALLETPDGTLWVGTENGVKKLPPTKRAARKFIALPHAAGDPASLSVGIVHALTADPSGGVWAGSRTGGVRRIDPRGHIDRFLADAQERSLFTDRSGTVWLGTLDEGVFTISGRPDLPVIENFRHDPNSGEGPGANEISCITEDRSGRIWFGTAGGGVSYVDPLRRKFQHRHHIPYARGTLSADLVRAMAVDPAGDLWVGSQGGGIDRFPRGNDRCVHYTTGGVEEKDNLLTALVCRGNGEVWAAYTFGGMVRMFPGRKEPQHFLHDTRDTTGLTGINVVRAMFEDSRGTLWIATHGFGVLRFDDRTGTFSRYGMSDRGRLRSNHVWCITEDRDGMIWFGLRTYGLARLDPATDAVAHFPSGAADSVLSDDPALALLAASDGCLWAATAGGGLQRLDPRRGMVTRYNESRGFPENMVYGILEDAHRDLWLSTGKGIVRFTPSTHKARLFGMADGIQSTEFTAGTCCVTPDGWMGFGGINGFNWFHPDSIAFNTVPPPVALTGFRVFDTERHVAPIPPPSAPLILRRDENFFSVEFAALDYTSPGENQYSYKLEGFDRDWVHAGRSHRATYTNVGPGEYIFRVQAANNDGVWNMEGASLAIVILPAVWETWWFRALVVIAAGVIGVVLYRYRINRLLAVHRTRERIARDLHDDVSAILSGIVYFSSAVETDGGNALSDRSSHFLTQIRRSSTEVLELLHDIIWSIHPDGDSLESILTKCRRFAADLCESRGIAHDILVTDSVPARNVDPEKRRDLWLMYKEMITNAVRHSACTTLQVRITVGPEGELALTVADNGTGFDSTQPGRESGLRNIRARATALKGDLHVVSVPGQGTRWEFRTVL